MNLKKIFGLILLIAVCGLAWHCLFPKKLLHNTPSLIWESWDGFKHFFIDQDGKVNRPKNQDAVSEGQAYAMLRAVWLDDQKTFDRVFRWTETHLSRKEKEGDHLLSWRWKGGKVVDPMPASDADIDYALSLVFAQSRWADRPHKDVPDYGQKASRVLKDILDLMTVRLQDGRLYLLPWIVEEKNRAAGYPLNPSYYSPAHFRIFYQFTGDGRWLELVDTTYYILMSLSEHFGGQKGVGLVPDWCMVDGQGNFGILEGKEPGFGWEAVRVPFRIGLDYFWFQEGRAKLFLSRMASFLEAQWQKNNAIYSEYDYTGYARNPYESPAFYSAYYFALLSRHSVYAQDILDKNRSYLKQIGRYRVYWDEREYFVNSLAWLAEALKEGVLKNFYDV